MTTQTTWTVQPVEDARLSVGDILLPMVEFPLPTRIVRCRRDGEYGIAAVIQGDGAHDLQAKYETPLPHLVVVEVSEISGFAKAVIRGTDRTPCELRRFNPRRAMRGVGAAEVSIGGELLWMTPREIEANLIEFGPLQGLTDAKRAYGEIK